MKPTRWVSIPFVLFSVLLISLPSGAQQRSALSGLDSPPHSSRPPIRYLEPTRENYLELSAQTEAMLHRDVLDVWFPRCVDHQHGGFSSNFRRDWQAEASQGKFSVF